MKALYYTFFLLIIISSIILPQRFPTENDTLRNGRKTGQFVQETSNDKPLYVPGEIIIKYRSPNNSELTGYGLLKEYEKIKNIIESSSNIEVTSYNPVYSSITDKMISQNITEKQVKQTVLLSAGLKRKKLNTPDTFLEYDFASTLTIRYKNKETEPLQFAKEIITNTELRNAGYIIEYAEPNYLYYTNYTVNDPLYEQQWALKQAKASEAWDIQTGNKNIKIGVIDTGIDYLHEDLKDNYYAEASYDFVDVDTNAYGDINYYPVPGEDYTITDPDPKDYNGHGTHCAGIIGARANNGKGICGVVHECSLISLRAGFSMRNGNSERGLLENDDISNAIIHAITAGVDILSMSFGGSEAVSTKNAIKTAANSGIILIAAAGNSNSKDLQYPAGYNNVISVAATDVFDAKASFSNFGYWVDVAAPGDYIYSTVPYTGGDLCDITGYKSLSGTSMATPFVAGLAALILSQHESFSSSQVEFTILKSVDTPKEVTSYIGRGRVNLLKALQLNSEKSMNINAVISSPKEYDIISQNKNIVGTAGGTNYTVSIGKGIYPQTWIEAGSGASITNGTLGSIIKSGFEDGLYTIKLMAYNYDAELEYRVPVVISSLDKLHAGSPLEFKAYFNEAEYTTGDIDGDNKKEIIGLNNPNSDAEYNYCDLVVYNSEGVLLKGFPARLPFSAFPRQKPKVADIDNDGINEIILFTYKHLTGFKNELCYITVYNFDAKIKPGFPVIISGGNESAYSAISDIDYDGYPDIVAAAKDGLYAINSKGESLNGWPVLFETDYVARSPLVITNLDDDPQLEVLCTSFYYRPPFTGPHYVAAYNYDGTPVQGFPFNQKEAWGWTLAAGDLDQNGQMELMSQKYRIGKNGEQLPWNTVNMESFSDFAIGNLNSDSGLEVAWGNYTGKAHLTDYEGNSLQGWPKQEAGYLADGTHLIADVAGDNKPEIIIGWISYQNEKTGIFAYNSDGTIAQGFPLFNKAFNFKNLQVDDIDNDGLSELIGNENNKVLVIDLEKPFNPKNMEWAANQNNPWETGAYNSVNNSLYSQRNYTIVEDSILKVRLSPTYIDWRKYEVIFTDDSSRFNYNFNNDVLSVIPDTNWSGAGTISIIVKDNGIAVASSSITINVTPVNDPPFALSNLPALEINEEECGNVVVPDLNAYFDDIDSDNLTFEALFDSSGLDSVLVVKEENKKTKSLAESSGRQLNNNINNYEPVILNKVSGIAPVSLIVYPKKDYSGTTSIIIKAKDDLSAEASDTLKLEVRNVNDKPSLGDIADVLLNEDDSIAVPIAVTDVDRDSLTLTFISNPDSISFICSYDSMLIKPYKNWFGTASVTCIVSDGFESDSADFSITVSSMNDAPDNYRLVLPLNGSEIKILSIADSVMFAWETATDAEGDSVFYRFVFSDSGNTITFENLIDTTAVIRYDQLAGLFSHGKIEAEWNVFAYDKYDTTDISNAFKIVIVDNITGVESSNIPEEFVLFQNYPNPFNPVTTIKYSLDKPGYVKLAIYDVLGQVVKYLVNEYQEAGYYSINWNATDKNSVLVGSGIYFYKIESDDNVQFKKMILLK